MLAEQFLAAAAGARNSTALDETIRLTWRAHAEGKLADADAEAISEVVRARRATLAGDAVQWPPALGSNLSGLTGFGRVEMWRGDVRLSMSVSAPFVWRWP
jgi:hypothetical protein